MRMKEMKRAGAVAAVLVLLLVLVGCGGTKQGPTTTPPPPPPTPTESTTTDVTPSTTPSDSGPVEPPQPMDLATLQEQARTQGLLGDVFYSYDSYGLDDGSRTRLSKNAEFFRSNPDLVMTVEGHCDERGTNEYNIALGQRRSTAAVDYLISLGIDGRRFKTISYGEERPFCTQSDAACWQKNRRARFVISGRQ